MNKSERLRNLTKRSGKNISSSSNKKNSNFQWRPFIALVFVYIIFILDWQWAWGILFLFWVVPDLFSGITYFIEPVSKDENPMLYWLIVISWILMSLFSLSTLFIDYNQFYY